MGANTYLDIVAGEHQQKAAIQTSAGAADAGKIPALDSGGKLPVSMLPSGVGPEVKNYPTFENLGARDIVNVYLDSGTLKLRKADADNNLPAHGYVTGAVTAPAAADVFFEGIIVGFVGLTKGARYYLDITAGGVTATPPTGTGTLVQLIGIAVSDTEINFEPSDYVKLA